MPSQTTVLGSFRWVCTSKSIDDKIVNALRKHPDLAHALCHVLLGFLSLCHYLGWLPSTLRDGAIDFEAPQISSCSYPPLHVLSTPLEVSCALCIPSLSWDASHLITVLRGGTYVRLLPLGTVGVGVHIGRPEVIFTLALLPFLPRQKPAHFPPSLGCAPPPGAWTLPESLQ